MQKRKLVTIGWWEWLTLPDLDISRVKAKVDTGARTSALHAWDIEVDETMSAGLVRFTAHPVQRDDTLVVSCEAPLVDWRVVRNSGGAEERRPVIETDIAIGGRRWTIEVTLTNRDSMGFRMLLGRTGVPADFRIDPNRFRLASGRARKKKKH